MTWCIFIGNEMDYRIWSGQNSDRIYPIGGFRSWFCDVNRAEVGIFDCLEGLNTIIYDEEALHIVYARGVHENDIRRNYAPLFYWWAKGHGVKATIKRIELGGKEND